MKQRICAKAFLCVLALPGLLWAVAAFSAFWNEASSEAMAQQILRGHSYGVEAIKRQLAAPPTPEVLARKAALTLPPRPGYLRNLAILQADLTDGLLGRADAPPFSAALPGLERRVIAALAVAPGDSFLWLMLFWSKSLAEGATARTLSLLERSYELGPNEGWIAVRRMRIVLPLLQALPPALSERAMAEFRALVASGFETGAAELVTGADAEFRQKLVDAVAGLPEVNRRKLAENLARAGLMDLTVPGIARAERRPWM